MAPELGDCAFAPGLCTVGLRGSARLNMYNSPLGPPDASNVAWNGLKSSALIAPECETIELTNGSVFARLNDASYARHRSAQVCTTYYSSTLPTFWVKTSGSTHKRKDQMGEHLHHDSSTYSKMGVGFQILIAPLPRPPTIRPSWNVSGRGFFHARR